MNENKVIAANVLSFLDKACADYGRMRETELSGFLRTTILEELGSPIEDLFFIAFCMQVEAVGYELNPWFVRDHNGEMKNGSGVFIKPQYKIGPYRGDFLVYQNGIQEEGERIPMVIELDGHDFHDRNKNQRAYEKSRDRFFVKHGYKVLHFTGSEVVADPYKVAFEVLSMLGTNIIRDEYDPQSPLGARYEY